MSLNPQIYGLASMTRKNCRVVFMSFSGVSKVGTDPNQGKALGVGVATLLCKSEKDIKSISVQSVHREIK